MTATTHPAAGAAVTGTTRPRGADDRVFLVAVAVAVVVTAGVTVWLIAGFGGPDVRRAASNLFQVASPLLATALCWLAAARTSDRSWRTGWILIGFSTLSWALGQMVWTWFEVVRDELTPFPSVADLGFLLAVPFAIAGLLFFPSSADRTSARTRTLLDAVIVAGSIVFVSWVFVLGPTLRSGDGTMLERAFSLAYPAADAVLLTIVIVAGARSDPNGRTATAFVGAGMVGFALADSYFVYTALHDLETTTISDLSWFAGYLLIALGALFAARNPLTRTPAAEAHPGRLALLLPYLPLAAVVVVAAAHRVADRDVTIDGVEFWVGIALIALLLVRQSIVLIENQSLTHSLAESMARLEHQAMHDLLTGLPNRTLFMDRLRMAVARTARDHELLAVMFLDLDGFKPVNDRLGHDTGDEVLITVADRIRRSLRTPDTVARFGGDEFLVLCERLPDADEAVAIAGRLQAALRLPIYVNDDEVRITCSVGLVLTDQSLDAGHLVRLADEAMYEVKAAGKDAVELLDRTFTGDGSARFICHR